MATVFGCIGEGAPRMMLLGSLILLTQHEAYGRSPERGCSLTRENGKANDCRRENLPRCIWEIWKGVRHAKPDPEECMFQPCGYEGAFDVREVELDGDRSTREYVLRYPLAPRGGTAENHPFVIEQAVKGKCTSLFVGNGELVVLKARDNRYLRLFEHAATGGPFCYVGVHVWNGKEYKVLEENPDASCEGVPSYLKKLGPVHLVAPRPEWDM